jgi:F-type H+-transporting ATPase subunit b
MEHEDTTHAADQAHGAVTEELAHGTAVPSGEGPIPLLQPAYFDNLIFWAVVAMIAIYFILTKMALPRIGSTIATREGTISSDLAAAEALRAQARDAQVAYDKALADARAEANRIAQQTRDAIQADLDAALAQADVQIDARAAQGARAVAEIQSQAQASVAEVARDAAREILRVMGGQVDEVAVDRAVAARMGG